MVKYRVQYRVTIACEVDFEMGETPSEGWEDLEEEAFDKGSELAWDNTYNIPNLVEFWEFEVDSVERIADEQN